VKCACVCARACVYVRERVRSLSEYPCVGGVLCNCWDSHGSTWPDMGVPLWPLVAGGLHDVIRSPSYAEVRMPTKRTQRLHVC